MCKFSLTVGVLIVAVAGIAAGQDGPHRVDFGMGFSFGRLHVPNSTETKTMPGIQFDATYNVNRWLGVQGEFTGHYHCISGCYWDASTARQKAFTFGAGPVVRLSNRGKVVPWVHVLAGVSNVSYSDDTGVDLASTSWAMVAGGGVDFKAGAMRIRALQVDMLNHAVGAERRNDLRMGVGVTVGFGRSVE